MRSNYLDNSPTISPACRSLIKTVCLYRTNPRMIALFLLSLETRPETRPTPLPLPPPERCRDGTGGWVRILCRAPSPGSPKLDPAIPESARTKAQEGRLGGRCPSGRASAASASPSLAAPARGPAGLRSQSPATGPPGTRLGRDGGCAKAAEVPAAARNNQRSSSGPSTSTPISFLRPTLRIPQEYSPLYPSPSRSGNNPLGRGTLLQATEVTRGEGGNRSHTPTYSTDHNHPQ